MVCWVEGGGRWFAGWGRGYLHVVCWVEGGGSWFARWGRWFAGWRKEVDGCWVQGGGSWFAGWREGVGGLLGGWGEG